MPHWAPPTARMKLAGLWPSGRSTLALPSASRPLAQARHGLPLWRVR